MIKENIDFWKNKSDVFNSQDCGILDYFRKEIEEISNELCAVELLEDSLKVIYNFSEYIAHQIQRKHKCHECSHGEDTTEPKSIYKSYLNLLSRSGLKHPSAFLTDSVGNAFTLLDYASRIIAKYFNIVNCRVLV